MRRAIIGQGVGAPVLYALTAGGLATVYAQMFDARDLMVGVINAVLMLGMVAGLAAPALIERYNKRRVMVGSQMIATVALFPLLAIPQIAASSSNHVALMIMAVALLVFSLALAAARSTWFPALLDFVPREETGWFFGRMRTVWQTLAIGIFIICAAVITPEAPPSRFQLIIVVLIMCMVVRMFFISRLPQRQIVPTGHKHIFSRLRMMFSDRRFMRFTWFSIVARSTAFIVFPSFMVFTRVLDFSARFLIIAMLLKMAAAALSYMFWGRLADHHGPGRNYRLGFMLVAAAHGLWLPVSWLVLTAGETGLAGSLILIIFAVYGAAEAGLGVALTRHSFHLTPRDRAPTYLAIQPILYSAIPGIGVFLAGWLLALLHADEFVGWFNPYVVSALLFALLTAALIPLVGRLLKD